MSDSVLSYIIILLICWTLQQPRRPTTSDSDQVASKTCTPAHYSRPKKVPNPAPAAVRFWHAIHERKHFGCLYYIWDKAEDKWKFCSRKCVNKKHTAYGVYRSAIELTSSHTSLSGMLSDYAEASLCHQHRPKYDVLSESWMASWDVERTVFRISQCDDDLHYVCGDHEEQDVALPYAWSPCAQRRWHTLFAMPGAFYGVPCSSTVPSTDIRMTQKMLEYFGIATLCDTSTDSPTSSLAHTDQVDLSNPHFNLYYAIGATDKFPDLLFGSGLKEQIMKGLSDKDDRIDGYIYALVREADPGYVKIGWTEDVDRRFKEHKSQCKFVSIKVAEIKIRISNAKKMESLIHWHLRAMDHGRIDMSCKRKTRSGSCSQKHTEWFKVDVNKACEVIQFWCDWSCYFKPWDLGGILSKAVVRDLGTHSRKDLTTEVLDRWQHLFREMAAPSRIILTRYGTPPALVTEDRREVQTTPSPPQSVFSETRSSDHIVSTDATSQPSLQASASTYNNPPLIEQQRLRTHLTTPPAARSHSPPQDGTTTAPSLPTISTPTTRSVSTLSIPSATASPFPSPSTSPTSVHSPEPFNLVPTSPQPRAGSSIIPARPPFTFTHPLPMPTSPPNPTPLPQTPLLTPLFHTTPYTVSPPTSNDSVDSSASSIFSMATPASAFDSAATTPESEAEKELSRATSSDDDDDVEQEVAIDTPSKVARGRARKSVGRLRDARGRFSAG